MFRNFNLAAGVLALALFGYAQYQGWSLSKTLPILALGALVVVIAFITNNLFF